MLADFKNSFTDRLSGKFETNACLNMPPHLKYVTTLPCEISMFKNRNAQAVVEANCHVSSKIREVLVYTAPGSAKTRSCSSCSAAAATAGWTLTLGPGS